MSHAYAEKDDVRHQAQGPHKERPKAEQANVYTIVRRMPVEADGRIRYRIKSKFGNVERVATEDELLRCP
jgi:hypothetical protein